MKLRPAIRTQRTHQDRAATLVECLVYIGVLATLLGVSTSAFYHCYEHMRSLRRNADEITHMLRIGELWRNDIRQAVRQPSLDEAEQMLHIPHRDGFVDYQFTDHQVRRRVGATAPWSSILTNLNQSQMRLEQQHGVAAWRWEVELNPLRRPARVQPLFTFTAVSKSLSAP